MLWDIHIPLHQAVYKNIVDPSAPQKKARANTYKL